MVKSIGSMKITMLLIAFNPFTGDGSHPVFGHGSHEHESPVESIAAPGEPNLGY